MSIVQFLKSKSFLKHLAFAVIAVIVLCFLMLKWLKFSTNHGEFVEVPSLIGKTLDVVEI